MKIKTGQHPLGKRIRRGFTLAEMLVVLAIMAILTTVAVQSLTPVQNQARNEATQRTLNNISAAIVSSTQSGGGSSSVSGFVTDVGGPPQSPDGTTSPLAELIFTTTGLPGYATYPAPSPDTDITMLCGWRGPYLKPPVSGNPLDIVDGWGQSLLDGNPPATFFPSSATPWPILVTSTANVTTGSAAASFSLNQYDMQSVQVTGTLYGINSASGTGQHVPLTASDWTVTLFVPNPYPAGDGSLGIPAATSQPILAIPGKISSSGGYDLSYSFSYNSGSPLSLSAASPNWPLWVGPRILRVRFVGTMAGGTTYYTPTGTSAGVSGQGAAYINLLPGTSHNLGDMLVLKK